MEKGIEDIKKYLFSCPNCGKQITKAVLFCCDLCKDEAKFVRYFRACILDGRVKKEDIQEALQIRLAHILAGGYSERLRRLPTTIREAVITRAQGRCQKCGGVGVQIDHISGSSSDLENLQLLCARCHNEKTRENFVTISPETHPQEWAKREALLSRVYTPQPILICDRPNWNELWRSLYNMRREVIKKKNSG